MLERAGKWYFGAKAIFRIIANNLCERSEDRLPGKCRRVLHALLIEDDHVIEYRLDVPLIPAVFCVRLHRHLEDALFESEAAVGFGEIVQFRQRHIGYFQIDCERWSR